MPNYVAPIAQGLSMLAHAAEQQRQLQQARQEFAQRLAMQQHELGLREQLEKANLLQSGARPVTNGDVTLPGSASPAFGDPLGVDSLPGAPAGTFAAEPGRTVSIGKSAFELPTLDEQSAAQAARAARRAREVYNATAVALPDQTADLLGLPRGVKVPSSDLFGYGGVAPALTRARAAASKPTAAAPKSDVYRTTNRTDAAGHPLVFDATTGKYISQQDVVVPSQRTQTVPALTPYQQRALQRQQEAAADEQEFRTVAGNVLAAAQGDPKQAIAILNGRATDKKSAARRQYSRVRKYLKGLEEKPDQFQDALRSLNGTAGQPGAVSGQQTLPQGTGAKIDRATAKLFMRAAGGDPAKARQLAGQYHWTF